MGVAHIAFTALRIDTIVKIDRDKGLFYIVIVTVPAKVYYKIPFLVLEVVKDLL